MQRFLIQKLLVTIPVLFLVSAGVFSLIHLIPGDPVAAMLGENATPEARAALRRELGLDRPLPEQYLVWIGRLLSGDLGRSIRHGLPVGQALADAMAPTLQLTVLALLVAVGIGVPAGILAATRPGSIADVVLSVLALIGASMPTFWSGLLLIYLFALGLRWLPPSGYVAISSAPLESLRYMVLPALTLGLTVAAVVLRQMRASLLDVLKQEYVRTAYSKGLSERVVVWRHALRNAAIPVLTVLGLTGGVLLGGAVLTETIFAIPGMGRLIVTAIFERDFPLVQGGVLLIACWVIVINLLVDVLYATLDPRIRY